MSDSQAAPEKFDAWFIARVVGAVGLASYYLGVLFCRFGQIWGEYACDGDQNQGAWQYWRYHVPGSLPPGQLLTDYAFAYHSPPFDLAWMATLSTFVQPLTAAKFTHIFAWTLLVIAVVYVVGKQTDWLLGIAAGFIAARNPDMTIYFGTGIARTWGPLLCVVFLGFFVQKKHYWCLGVLVLAAGLYPVIAMAGGITYGAYTVIAGPMQDRIKRMAGMFVAGLFILGLAKWQDWKSPEWWGPIVTYEEAAKMPAWGPGGRWAEVPLRPWRSSITNQIGRPYKENGHLLGPVSFQKWMSREENLWMVVVPGGLAAVVVLVDRIRRRRRRLAPPDDNAQFPWQFAALFAGSIASYFVAREFAFKFFLPQRQLTYIIPWVVMTGLPVLVWCAARTLTKNRAYAIAMTVGLTVLPCFVFRGDGLEVKSVYVDHKADEPLWKFIRTLPLDANIAADNYVADVMGMFTWHAAWANRTMTHPFRKGLYDEEERRLVETSRALFATSFADVAAFGEREHVDYLVYNTHKVTAEEGWMFVPAKQKIDKIFRATKGKTVLEHPPKEATIFNWKDYRVLDLKKLKAWVDAQPPPPPPDFIGPQLPPPDQSP